MDPTLQTHWRHATTCPWPTGRALTPQWTPLVKGRAAAQARYRLPHTPSVHPVAPTCPTNPLSLLKGEGGITCDDPPWWGTPSELQPNVQTFNRTHPPPRHLRPPSAHPAAPPRGLTGCAEALFALEKGGGKAPSPCTLAPAVGTPSRPTKEFDEVCRHPHFGRGGREITSATFTNTTTRRNTRPPRTWSIDSTINTRLYTYTH